MATRISFTTSFLVVACIAYTLFYILFVIGQRTWSAAFLASGLYFIPYIYGSQVKNATILLVCIVIHAIASLAQLGFTIFFFVEIFVNHPDKIIEWLSKYSKGDNTRDVARYACIAMSVDGFITFLVLLAAFYLSIIKWRSLRATPTTQRRSTPPQMEETLAVNLEFEKPITIPRLRQTSSYDQPASYTQRTFSTTYQTRF